MQRYRRTPLLALTAAIVLLALPGCQRWKAKKAAKKYAEEIQSSNRQLLELNKSLSRFNQNTASAKVLRHFIKDEVLPKWGVYLKALRAVPAGTAELGEIHQLLINAHIAQFQAQQALVQGLNDKNLAERVKVLKAAIPQLRKRESEYLRRVRAYYQRHGLKVKD